MQTIAVYIQNKLLSSGISHAVAIKKPKISIETIPNVESCFSVCKNSNANVLIAELRDYYPLSLDDWLNRVDEIKHAVSSCKIILIVDEENFPQAAKGANSAFKNDEIDMFLYSSSGLNYLVDVIINI